MPIETTRIAPGLFLNRWQGDVTMAHVTQAEQVGAQMLLPEETRVVLINDLSAADRFPTDIRALRRITETNPRVIALLVVDAPSMIRMVGEAQARQVQWIIEFYDTLGDALERGRVLLE
ncbi:MAG: hypothetical protein K8L99_17635 [Anaerolineae bacterium]|nr:hypothetical protein [Anaerolineae bacterium]